MKYLIVGLGNIGAEYQQTRHNIGFKVVDRFSSDCSGSFSSDRYGSISEVRCKGKSLILLKPSTYMNLSGNAVRYWMQNLKIEPQNLLIVVDDVALPFGTLRLRKGGSDGGHNGLKHINEVMGNGYARLRVGIGDDFPRGFLIDYVLGQWKSEELDQMDELLERTSRALECFVRNDMSRAMNIINTKPAKAEE
ncbi:MAG: aminoacyl-tRNA hydrolase [Rikenellaceae bacterium]